MEIWWEVRTFLMPLDKTIKQLPVNYINKQVICIYTLVFAAINSVEIWKIRVLLPFVIIFRFVHQSCMILRLCNTMSTNVHRLLTHYKKNRQFKVATFKCWEGLLISRYMSKWMGILNKNIYDWKNSIVKITPRRWNINIFL